MMILPTISQAFIGRPFGSVSSVEPMVLAWRGNMTMAHALCRSVCTDGFKLAPLSIECRKAGSPALLVELQTERQVLLLVVRAYKKDDLDRSLSHHGTESGTLAFS